MRPLELAVEQKIPILFFEAVSKEVAIHRALPQDMILILARYRPTKEAFLRKLEQTPGDFNPDDDSGGGQMVAP